MRLTRVFDFGCAGEQRLIPLMNARQRIDDRLRPATSAESRACDERRDGVFVADAPERFGRDAAPSRSSSSSGASRGATSGSPMRTSASMAGNARKKSPDAAISARRSIAAGCACLPIASIA